MIYKLTKRILVYCLICLAFTGCFFHEGSYLKSTGRIDLQFDEFEEKEGTIRLADTTELEIIYEDFILAEGELELKILSLDDEIMCNEKFISGGSQKGKVVLTDLTPEQEYRYIITGNNALQGRITISWKSMSKGR